MAFQAFSPHERCSKRSRHQASSTQMTYYAAELNLTSYYVYGRRMQSRRMHLYRFNHQFVSSSNDSIDMAPVQQQHGMAASRPQMSQTDLQRTGQHRGSSSSASGGSSGGGCGLEFGGGAPGMLPHQMLQPLVAGGMMHCDPLLHSSSSSSTSSSQQRGGQAQRGGMGANQSQSQQSILQGDEVGGGLYTATASMQRVCTVQRSTTTSQYKVYRIDYALASKYACCSTEAVSTLSVYDVLHHTTSIPSNNAQRPQGGRRRSSSNSRGSRGRGGSSSDAEDGAPGA
eukprot:8919-Heterococcus_DN1.PRE.4